MKDSEPYRGYEGLNQLTVADLKDPDKIFSMLAVKLDTLDPRHSQSPILVERVRFLMDLLREALANRYQRLSISAFAHILVALDYFLKVKDRIPDTRPNGMTDDRLEIDHVFKSFQLEFDVFRQWKSRQPTR